MTQHGGCIERCSGFSCRTAMPDSDANMKPIKEIIENGRKRTFTDGTNIVELQFNPRDSYMMRDSFGEAMAAFEMLGYRGEQLGTVEIGDRETQERVEREMRGAFLETIKHLNTWWNEVSTRKPAEETGYLFNLGEFAVYSSTPPGYAEDDESLFLKAGV